MFRAREKTLRQGGKWKSWPGRKLACEGKWLVGEMDLRELKYETH